VTPPTPAPVTACCVVVQPATATVRTIANEMKTKARPKLKNFMRIPLTAREAQMSMKGVRISVRGFGVTFATGFASVFTLGFVPTSALADSFCVVTHPHNISARAGIKKASFIGVSPDRET
jgi:hypothetical protein